MNIPSIPEEIRAVMRELYPPDKPGAALAVVEGGKILLAEGYGLANLQTAEKITVATAFRMASVSKQFTAMSIMLLFVRQKVALEDAISEYIDDLPMALRSITIKQLLTHTSGIPDYEILIPRGQKTPLLDEDVVQLVRQEDKTYFPPGFAFKYSNTGYCLLAMIVQRVSGRAYADFVRQNIFQPLRMDHSQIYEEGKAIACRALGYRMTEGEYRLADQNITSASKGDGGVYTTIKDYLRWSEALFGNMLISKEATNMFAPQVVVKGGIGYGYGWFVGKEKDGSACMFHSGESTGFRNIIYRNARRNLLIAIFSNREGEVIAKTFEEVAKQLNVQPSFGDEYLSPGGTSLFHYLHSIYN